MKTSTIVMLIAGALVLLLGLIGAAVYIVIQKDNRYTELLTAYQANTTSQFELLASNSARSDNIYLSSQELMQAQLELISDIPDQIATLLEREDVEPVVITRTEGRVEGETIMVYIDNLSDIPRQLQFLTSEGMPVAFYNIVDTNEGTIEMETGVYDLYVATNQVVALDPAGVPTVVTEATIASSASPETTYPIVITSSTSWFTETGGREFHWWDPHMELGALVGYGITEQDILAGGDLALTVMSYGNETIDSLRVLRAGIVVDSNSARISVSPVGYNLGTVIPLIDDTWVYPMFLFNLSHDYGFGIEISSTL